MRLRLHVAAVAVPVLLLPGSALLDAQRAPERPRLSNQERAEAAELVRLVQAVQDGQYPGGDAYLTIQPHFLRAPDGRTYVPFTVSIDDAPEGFETVGMYVRVVSQTTSDEAAPPGPRHTGVDPADVPGGALPVSVPERQFRSAGGGPVPGDASARLAAVERSLRMQDPRYPFEDFHFLTVAPARRADPRRIRRALSVPAGTYDVYVAVREREGGRGAPPPRAAVLRRTLEVPDFSAGDFSLSSVILADHIAPVDGTLSPLEQRARPYALGTAEVLPADRRHFHTGEDISVVFFVHDFAVDGAGVPDLTVQYRFYRPGIPEQLYQQTAPDTYGPAEVGRLDPRAPRQIPISASIPLASFLPGPYRLEIAVTDRLTSRQLTRSLEFFVEDGVEDAEPTAR